MANFRNTPEYHELEKIVEGKFMEAIKGSSLLLSFIPRKESVYFSQFLFVIEFLFSKSVVLAQRPSPGTLAVFAIFLHEKRALSIKEIRRILSEYFITIDGNLEIIAAESDFSFGQKRYYRSIFSNMRRNQLFKTETDAGDLDGCILNLSKFFHQKLSAFKQRHKLKSLFSRSQ